MKGCLLSLVAYLIKVFIFLVGFHQVLKMVCNFILNVIQTCSCCLTRIYFFSSITKIMKTTMYCHVQQQCLVGTHSTMHRIYYIETLFNSCQKTQCKIDNSSEVKYMSLFTQSFNLLTLAILHLNSSLNFVSTSTICCYQVYIANSNI